MDIANKLTAEQIEKAVNWWANKLDNPRFDNGDTSQSGGMVMMLAMLARQNEQPLNGKVEAFKTALKTRLEAQPDADWASLHVDYSPEGLLYEALREAGIPVSNTTLSWKTHMRFRNGGVFVSEGYRAEEKEL